MTSKTRISRIQAPNFRKYGLQKSSAPFFLGIFHHFPSSTNILTPFPLLPFSTNISTYIAHHTQQLRILNFKTSTFGSIYPGSKYLHPILPFHYSIPLISPYCTYQTKTTHFSHLFWPTSPQQACRPTSELFSLHKALNFGSKPIVPRPSSLLRPLPYSIIIITRALIHITSS